MDDDQAITWLAVVLILAAIWFRYRPYLDGIVFNSPLPASPQAEAGGATAVGGGVSSAGSAGTPAGAIGGGFSAISGPNTAVGGGVSAAGGSGFLGAF